MKILNSFIILGIILEGFCADDLSKEIKSQMSLANNEFAFDMLKFLPLNDNNFFSPMSISVAMAMTSLGAGSNTLNEIKAAFHFNDVENATSDSLAVDKFFKEILKTYTTENPDYSLNLANGLFIRNNISIKEDFFKKLLVYYKTSVAEVNFISGKVEGIINKWVDDKTNHKIHELFSPDTFTSDTVMVLANAIYFKGTWRFRFDEQFTKNGEFHLADGSTKTVPMMSRTASFHYTEDEDLNCHVLQLAYLGHLNMVVFLPIKGTLSELIPQLNAKRLKSAIENLEPRQIELKFPKVKLENKYMLKEILQKLHINDLFSDGADLSGISDLPLKVSSVVHKTFVDINEKGTEAAGATGIEFNLKSMPIAKPIKLIINRPYFFTIIDERFEDVMLFAGIVNDP